MAQHESTQSEQSQPDDIELARKRLVSGLEGARVFPDGHLVEIVSDNYLEAYARNAGDNASASRLKQVARYERRRRYETISEVVTPAEVKNRGALLALSGIMTFISVASINSYLPRMDEDGFDAKKGATMASTYILLRVMSVLASQELGLPRRRTRKILTELEALQAKELGTELEDVRTDVEGEAQLFINAGTRRQRIRRATAFATAATITTFSLWPGRLVTDEPSVPRESVPVITEDD